jgi:hypothetical protein
MALSGGRMTRLERTALTLAVVLVVVGAIYFGTLVYVAAHFIEKLW